MGSRNEINAPATANAAAGTILIVDDDPANLGILGRLLRPDYNVLAAPSGERALAIAGGSPKPDLILLDMLMPGMDGNTVLAHLHQNPATCDIPVIFVTGLDSVADETNALDHGAVDYIAKPYSLPVVLARVHTHLELKRARDCLRDQNAYLEAEVARRVRDIVLVQDITIYAFAELAEARDTETGNHILRTQEYVRLLAVGLQGHPRFSEFLTDQAIALLAKSAPLHDIGKVGIPDHILLKPGKLTADEWEVMKTHTILGARAIEGAVRKAGRPTDFLDMARQIAHFHHERWDGSGYPEGRKGEAIPIPARLMALADVFDALISRRVYKQAMPAEAAREIIVSERGRHFDPAVVDAFVAGYGEFARVAREFQEDA